MATKSRNGLEQAMILLMQNQAAFQSQLIAMNERFGRIESELHEIKSILLQHGHMLERHGEMLERHGEMLVKHGELLQDHDRLLQALPEAIRQKIGFGPRQG